ncbi:MAG TPA: sulfite exporter TauE/SafE family protein, partial [Actinomycetota bacterium]|nr:sulfite exporter TauE/SafE family protein [Actinomycetota bacterium]
PLAIVATGLLAGLLSGLFGVGGGVVMIPLLVALVGFSQHRAHATSLGAIVPIAAVATVTFAAHGQIDPYIGGLLAVGSLAGAPVGARVMKRMPQAALRIVFGCLMIVVGGLQLWT